MNKGVTNIVEQIEKKPLLWLGHTKRMDDSRLPKRIFERILPANGNGEDPEGMMEGWRKMWRKQ